MHCQERLGRNVRECIRLFHKHEWKIQLGAVDMMLWSKHEGTLAGIMLRDISQAEKDKCCMDHLYVESYKAELIEVETRMTVTRG